MASATLSPAAEPVTPPAGSDPIGLAIIKLGHQSATGLAFDVDVHGKVKNCRIVEGSGAAYLDEGACRILTEKAQFRPFRDSKGKVVEAIGRTTRIVWRIEG